MEEIGELSLKSGKEHLRIKKDQVQQAKMLLKEEANSMLTFLKKSYLDQKLGLLSRSVDH